MCTYCGICKVDLIVKTNPWPFKRILCFSFQILYANKPACRLLECSNKDLIGKKLSCVLKKTSQVLEEALEEDFPNVDGSITALSGKVVWNNQNL